MTEHRTWNVLFTVIGFSHRFIACFLYHNSPPPKTGNPLSYSFSVKSEMGVDFSVCEVLLFPTSQFIICYIYYLVVKLYLLAKSQVLTASFSFFPLKSLLQCSNSESCEYITVNIIKFLLNCG